MNTKMIVGLCVIICLLFLPTISAIGIMPAGKLYDYSPGEVHSLKLTVLNNDQRNMEVSLYAKGNLSDAVVIQDRFMRLSADESEKSTTATIVIPKNLPPGLNTFNIVALEVPGESTSEQGDIITATGSVISQIRINVPFPGLYAKAEMIASSASADDPVGFVISVFNAGSDDIDEVFADITIYGPTNEKIVSFQTDRSSIDSKKEVKIEGAWLGSKNAGKYFARATVHYDGKKLLLEKVFEVGDKNLVVSDIHVESYSLGSIAKVIMDIQNNWNQDIKELYAQTEIIDKRGSVVSEFKTITTSIEAFSKGVLEGFWDTNGMGAGEYDMKITLFYDGERSTTVQPVYLGFDEVSFLEQPGTGMVIGKSEEKGGSSILLLTVMVVFLVVFNVSLFFYMRKKFSKKR